MQRAEITMGRGTRVIQYLLDDGWEILAGKTAADNDELSLKIAYAKDWWFHVRGTPGSHVLLRHRDNAEPDREVLRIAAAIAAFHSKARDGGQVGVAMTRAEFVSKPRGAKEGTVSIRKERVIKVRPGLPL
jgi:predicted ribosome quality control (RQC) complex YloA/Tae2 family protein